ncbi:hypothetical protein EV363DRAFT_1332237 [Boletus edulis]|nr:hypothetical protein EV363DRAFT_1332237 [Boletus edulis]
MAPNLVPGSFQIVSLIEGNPPTSVNLTKPAGQSVYLKGPVTNWKVKKESDNTWHLTLGGYPYTGVVKDKVTATINDDKNVKWIATYREFQDGYTIQPADKPSSGWTVHSDSEDGSPVEIKTIIEFKSLPPKYLTSQLFRFVPVLE